MDGMPLGALRQCAECQKWFLHISEKIKLYCSNRCAARKATRDSRARIKEEQPKKHKAILAKNRERAHEHYVKKIKAKKPKAKIDRHPRKI
jgi:predicted amidophosphoribosyltransferase